MLAFAMQGDGDKTGELLSMLTPIRHADSLTGVRRYMVEPYVACADVYSEPPHVGRGGWTWYTGSAGWLYRVALEAVLGFQLQGTNLVLNPCIPHGWLGFSINFRYRSANYEIAVENPLGICRGILAIRLDGAMLEGNKNFFIPLVDDNATHRVKVVLG
jgi:cyclic beta-1,2-glucan glucanotransferase